MRAGRVLLIEVPAFAGTVAFGHRLLRRAEPIRLQRERGSGVSPVKVDCDMAVDGTWNLTMQTPMGERKATLVATSQGGTLTGKQSGDGGTTDIFDSSVSGNDVSWKISITNPMPLTLQFTGAVDGDKMSGKMSAGALGSWPFSGVRA
jgi:hypothetical protein